LWSQNFREGSCPPEPSPFALVIHESIAAKHGQIKHSTSATTHPPTARERLRSEPDDQHNNIRSEFRYAENSITAEGCNQNNCFFFPSPLLGRTDVFLLCATCPALPDIHRRSVSTNKETTPASSHSSGATAGKEPQHSRKKRGGNNFGAS
jgi:hypothetical protein